MIPQKPCIYLFLAIVWMFSSLQLYATNQQPDILIHHGDSLNLSTGWGYPSPLQTYYYNNKIKYPFQRINTGNYRGHIAYWKINGDSLFLTNVKLKDKIHKPEDFVILNKTIQSRTNNGIYADWFSGVIQCYLTNEDYDLLATHYYFIRNGIILESEIIYNNYEPKNKLHRVYEDYITCYYRTDDDIFYWKDELAYLESNYTYHHSPIYEYYGGYLHWTRNWENNSDEPKGAPNCSWIVSNDTLFLNKLFVFHNLNFDTIEHYMIDLKSEFHDKYINSHGVYADWVNGLFLIKVTELPANRWTASYRRSSIISEIYIRIEDGVIVEFFENQNSDQSDNKLRSSTALKNISREYNQ